MQMTAPLGGEGEEMAAEDPVSTSDDAGSVEEGPGTNPESDVPLDYRCGR